MKVLIIISVIILTIFLYIGSIYFGYLPIPKFAINLVVKDKNLSDDEKDKLYQLSKVYQILKKDNNAELNELQNIIINGSSTEDIEKFIKDNHANISDKTYDKIFNELELEISDSDSIKKILGNYSKNLYITDEDKEFLFSLKDKYGLQDSTLIKMMN